MSKLYDKLQFALSNYEERPVLAVTKYTFGDAVYIIRGKDKGREAWHYALVPSCKQADFKAVLPGATLNILNFGEIVVYRNKKGEISPMSRWGKDPPKMLQRWIETQYDTHSFEQMPDLIYKKDDIRLCIMQRAILKQRLGILLRYCKQERFHYVELTSDLESSLAKRVGIKDYDVVISLNGVNIEKDTEDQYSAHWNAERHLPVEMLVCSLATYRHYKAKKKNIHCELPTVQRLMPVYATSISDSNTNEQMVKFDERMFCLMHLETINNVYIVPQSAVFKSPEFTRVNDVCFAEIEGQYYKGKIRYIGSYSDCEKIETVALRQMRNELILNNSRSMKLMSIRNEDDQPTVFEQLPNELLLYAFTCLEMHHLYRAFWGLNSRFNHLFQLYQNSSLTFDENTDQTLMKFYAPYVRQLTIDTSIKCDLSQLSSLQTLVLWSGNYEHIRQIQPYILPNLTHLSFLLGCEHKAPTELITNIFTGRFPLLCYLNLNQIDQSKTYLWSIAPSLRFISIRIKTPQIIEDILITCPNLDHLQLHILNKNEKNVFKISPITYPLRRLTLWSHTTTLNLNDIDAYLSYTPDLQYLYLQTEYQSLFIDLVKHLMKRLQSLLRFDCHVKELIATEKRIDNLSTIQQCHPNFTRIKCIVEEKDFRIFATD